MTSTPETPPHVIVLRAGPWTAWFDPETVFLRRIRLGDDEVIRAIYAVVRDAKWATVPNRLLKLQTVIEPEAFRLELEVECRADPIRFYWRGLWTGTSAGEITCTFDGRAESTFSRARIGFCVLHPVSGCAGAPARAEHVDGTVSHLRFPEQIEPQIFGSASFHDLRAITHEIRPGTWVRVAFGGDTFETEDQRNWTDASFKTYCTPLAIPFPVEIQAGTQIQQRVHLNLEAPLGRTQATNLRLANRTRTPFQVPEKPTGVLPEIGTALPDQDVELTPTNLSARRQLHLGHLRVDLDLGDPGWRGLLSRASSIGIQTDLPLQLVVRTPECARLLEELARELAGAQHSLRRVTVLTQGEPVTRPGTLRLARATLERLRVPIGAGTDAHFCDLNREQALKRFVSIHADFISWPITPQVHAFDPLSIMETLEAQPQTVATARGFFGGPVVISPVTLLPRRKRGLAWEADPRQHSDFVAAWSLGTLAALSSANVLAVTLFELLGPRGLTPDDSSPSGTLPSLLRRLTKGSGVSAGVMPDTAAFLALYTSDKLDSVLLANLQPQAARLAVQLPRPLPTAIWTFVTNGVSRTGCGSGGLVEVDSPPYGCHLLSSQKTQNRSALV